MSSLNSVHLIGRLGQDPELRQTDNQNSVTTLSVATSEYRKVAGESQEFTEWHRVVCWGRTAENCSKYLSKGSLIFVDGRLQTESYIKKDTDIKMYTTKIVASRVQFLDSKKKESSDDHPPVAADTSFNPDTLPDIPF